MPGCAHCMKSVLSPEGGPVTMLLAVLWIETMSLRIRYLPDCWTRPPQRG